MKLYNYIIILILLAGLTAFSSCSKSINNPLEAGTSFSMKVNGQNWDAVVSSMMSEPHEDQEWGKYHSLLINANRIVENTTTASGDDLLEAITIMINLPEGKFRNAKGTYPFTHSENEISKAWAIFVSTENNEYSDQFIPVSGTFEITNSEVGNTKVYGYETGKEGFTKISGKFQLEMKSINGSKTVKITDGKFNLTDAMNIN